ncbi:DUF4396 domain-containing protein [Streptomyces genisteinicus]|uniref:DUF4396 domain-containing protein n=1 Tax=Streptomyces genisteinicus TaxID=2768068 RepID=A0A7H0HQR5_9ACTN|nr:DUF4396 domain-containing protein [Streptomyces genisteinicus]QNP62881.1 DUF4396 domain-containing protein [Streptomyces genisteinicus]
MQQHGEHEPDRSHHRTGRHTGHDENGGRTRHESHEAHGARGAHTGHPDHGHRPGHAATGWATAVRATLHCLTGCAVGEVLGMVIGTALGWGNAPTMVLAIVLAFFFGYSLTLWAVTRAGLGLKAAVGVALAADTLSITVMEVVDNGVLLLIPGAMDAHLTDGLFWGALAFAFLVAFLVTTPVNKWLIGRGKGHAVAHRHH